MVTKVLKDPEALRWIEAHRAVWEPRGNACHAALQRFCLHRWSAPPSHWPASVAVGQPLSAEVEPFRPYRPWIEPLLAQPLWDHAQVVGSELMLASLAANVAGTPDVVLRFHDGSHGVLDLKTLSAVGRRYNTQAQLGGYSQLLHDTYGLTVSRCLTAWAGPGRCQIITYPAEACRQRWLSCFARYTAAWRPF